MSRNFELLTQIQSELGEARVLGTMSKSVRPIVEAASRSESCVDAVSEEMVRLVQRVFLTANGNGPRKVLFFGVDDSAGSSSVCARTGRALAVHSSLPVCLVDANLQSSHLCRMFGIISAGKPESGPTSLRERCAQVGANLWVAGASVLASGRSAFPGVNELKEAMTRLREEFEYLLIDVAGANVRGDAVLLGQVTDAAVLVVEAHSTRRVAARKAKEMLDAANVRLLGTVLHNRTFPIPEKLYRKL